MCFSATASFAGGIAITSIGVASLKEVHKPYNTLFGSIPLVFGVQQISEGCLWLALSNPEYAHFHNAGTYIFLIIARIIWPTMVPLSILLMEPQMKKKKLILPMLGMGVSVSLYYTYCLSFLNVVPRIAEHHIQYVTDYPESLAVVVFLIYVAATVPPFFISSIPRLPLFGTLMLVSSTVTAIFFVQYVTSVWCFFAAVLSVVIYWILKDSKEQTGDRNPKPIHVEMESK